MSKTNCTAKIMDDSQITIENLSESAINIDLSGDVDFTSIVNILSERIDAGQEITLSVDSEESNKNSKATVIIETLKDIFEKFNSIIKADIEGIETQ